MRQFNNVDPENSDDGEADRQAVERLTRVCEDFRRELQAGNTPRLEQFLAAVAPELRADLLRRLLAIDIELMRNLPDGKVCSLQEYLDRFPDHHEIVVSVYRSMSTDVGGDTALDERPRVLKGGRRKARAKPIKPTLNDFIGKDFTNLTLWGQGSQGAVYRVFDESTGRPLAVKIPHRYPDQTENDVKQNESVLKHEAKLLGRLKDKGARVPIDYGVNRLADGTPYLALEYFPRGSLEQILEARHDRKERTWQQWCQMMIDLARTLEVIHAEGIYHFDIKPANILIDNDDRPVLCDFAASAEHEQYYQGAPFGVTRGYTAPEHERLKNCPDAPRQADGRTDIYSLGCVFYAMLTGKDPPDPKEPLRIRPNSHNLADWTDSAKRRVSELIGKVSNWIQAIARTSSHGAAAVNPKHRHTSTGSDGRQYIPPQPPGQLLPGLPKSVEQICLDMLEPDFEKRINSAREVVSRLQAVLARDANPPANRIKTAISWGVYGLSIALAGGGGYNWNRLVVGLSSGGFIEPIHVGNSATPILVFRAIDDWTLLKTDWPALFQWSIKRSNHEGDTKICFEVQLTDNTNFALASDFIDENHERIAGMCVGLRFHVQRVDTETTFLRSDGRSSFIAHAGERVLHLDVEKFTMTKDSPWLQESSACRGATIPLSAPLGAERAQFEVDLSVEQGILKSIRIDQQLVEFKGINEFKLSGWIGFLLDSHEVFLRSLHFSRN